MWQMKRLEGTTDMDVFRVLAHWDNKAGVWWTESEDVRGLVAESATLEGLLDDIKRLIPDLLELNHGSSARQFQIHLLADRVEGVLIAA
jgi:predicted RNase H-like HicB family nuclease